MDFLKPTILAIPFFLVTFTLEWWAVKAGRANGRYETKDALTSLGMGLGSVVADTLLRLHRPLAADAVLALPPLRHSGDVVDAS